MTKPAVKGVMRRVCCPLQATYHYPPRAMLEGWFFMAAALLILSGGAKLRDPVSTRGALAAAGLPARTAIVYLLGAIEITAAVAAVTGSWFGSLAVAGLYAGFAGFVGLALARRLPIQSCGCFGKADTPPTALHVVINFVSAVVALAIAARSGASLIEMLEDQPGLGIPYLVFVGIGTFLLALTLTDLATLSNRRRAT